MISVFQKTKSKIGKPFTSKGVCNRVRLVKEDNMHINCKNILHN